MKSTILESSISQLRSCSTAAMRQGRISMFGACLLLLCSLWPLASQADNTTVTQPGPSYLDTSTLGPVTQTGGKNLPQYTTFCNWVLTGLQNAGFTPANKWNFTFAGAAGSSFFQTDETTNQYDPYVVNQPDLTAPDGTPYPGQPRYQGKDLGGADFVMTYKPAAGSDDPNGPDIHWIQAFRESLKGGSQVKILLDQSNKAKRDRLPWYDDGSAAKMDEASFGGASWFLDTPLDGASNAEANVQFQVFLAKDIVTGGVNNVILYGGEWWGYDYTIAPAPGPVPEPSTLLLLGSGLVGLSTFLRKRRHHAN